MKKATFIDSIPSGKLTKTELGVLLLCGAPYRVSGHINPPPERLLTALDVDSALFVHWIYKKHWNEKHKLPWMKKESREALDKEGELGFQILRLCLGLAGYENSDTAALRWGAIFIEGRILGLRKVYEILPSKETNQVNLSGASSIKKIDKRNLKQHLQEKSKKLGDKTDPSNPFAPTKLPQFSSLIEDAIAKEKQNTAFKNSYWRPFTKAYSSWANSVDQAGTAIAYCNNGEWYQRDPLSSKTQKKIPCLDPFYNSTPVTLTWKDMERLQHSFSSEMNLMSFYRERVEYFAKHLEDYDVCFFTSNPIS